MVLRLLPLLNNHKCERAAAVCVNVVSGLDHLS